MRLDQLISWEGDSPVWVAAPLVYNPFSPQSDTDLLDLFALEMPVASHDIVELMIPMQGAGIIVQSKIRILGLNESKGNPLRAYVAEEFYTWIFDIKPTGVGSSGDPWSPQKHVEAIRATEYRERLENISRRVILFRGNVFLASRVPSNEDKEEEIFLLAEDQLNKKRIKSLRLRTRVERQRRMLARGGTVNSIRRRSLPDDLVSFILERDKVCQECGGEENLQLDHIIPVSRGGNDSETNLRLLCGDCNRRRGDLSNY